MVFCHPSGVIRPKSSISNTARKSRTATRPKPDTVCPPKREWEYACRAGAATSYCFGQSEELLGKYGWHDGISGGRTQAVGTRKPNDWGLFDMHGNVYEWCHDRYFPTYVADPNAKDEGKCMRGGSFEFPADSARSASRNFDQPAQAFPSTGFRPVRTLSSTGP
ncbi:MAG: formylglycine-generating enzyme family protein [Betaproteobacteria bacterium]